MNAVEAPDAGQSIDRIPRIPERLHLPPRHDTVLTTRDLG